eukprot:1886630-Karenia_brevis.AAC.1
MEDNEAHPHREGTVAWEKYESVKAAGTVSEAKKYGACAYDVGEWCKKGKLRILEKLESKGGSGLSGKGGSAAEERRRM